MREIINRIIDIKSAVTSVAVVVVTLASTYTQMDRVINSISDGIYARVTEPTYTLVKYDLLKQLEKLENDPVDIKRADVLKFTDFCDGYFGMTYVPSQPSLVSRDLKIACEKVIELYNGAN